MLRNVRISDLIKALVILQKESPLVNIEISEEMKGVIRFYPVRDTNANASRVNIEIPKDPDPKLDIDDLDKLIV